MYITSERLLRVAAIAAILLTITTAVHASLIGGVSSWVPLPPTHPARPTEGTFSWTQVGATQLRWTQYMKWHDPQWTELRKSSVYRLEVEAYNPGAGSNCDRLHAVNWAKSLPLEKDPTIRNGCGSSAAKEEVKFYINEQAVQKDQAYYTEVLYNKVGTGAVMHWEVNWSFANLIQDFWLAKIGYDITWEAGFWYYRPWCSSPAQILGGYGACP